MELFKRPDSQKIITSTSEWVLAMALALFLVMLISDASQLTNMTTDLTVRSMLGLYELHKGPVVGGGYEASIKFMLPALAAYVGAAAVLVVGICWVRLRKRG